MRDSHNLIYHIYWGTSGNSGLYLDEIYQCLKEADFQQKVFVSYYYPFDYGEKIFFRRSDMAHCKVRGVWRKVIQAKELVLAFSRILFDAYREKPALVNYSLISGSYNVVVLFLKMLKKLTGCKLMITCHDVVPFGNHSAESVEMKNRKMIFDMADYLLVHNENSVTDLESVFHIDSKKVLRHLFPIMDLRKLASVELVDKQFDFLFIGHLRQEKGIDCLLNAWEEFHKQCDNASLWVCGNAVGKKYETDYYAAQNVTFRLGYVSDEDYCSYIQQARYVVLPYTKGTNSGIISTVFSLGTQVLTSDIPMFKMNYLVNEEDMFEAGNPLSLINMLKTKYYQKEERLPENKLNRYREQFKQEVLTVYKGIPGVAPEPHVEGKSMANG